jgi:tetratricopeptide (TPR) repeat protein
MVVQTSNPEWAEAKQLFQSGDKAGAMQKYEQLARQDPSNATTLLMLGNETFHLGKLKEAMQYFERALEITPDFGHAQYRLGVCAFRAGHLDKAISCFRANLANPDQRSVMSYYWIGICEFFLGHDGKAIEALECLRQESPESCFCNLILARLLLKRCKFQSVIELLTELLSVTPDLVEAHYLIGLARKGLCQPFEALQSFRKVLQIDPSDEPAQTQVEILTGECPP